MEYKISAARGMLLCGAWTIEVSVLTGLHHMKVTTIYNDQRREGKLK